MDCDLVKDEAAYLGSALESLGTVDCVLALSANSRKRISTRFLDFPKLFDLTERLNNSWLNNNS